MLDDNISVKKVIIKKILIIASISIIPVAMNFLMSSASYYEQISKSWMLYPFACVPITAVIYGFYLKKHGIKYKSIVICGAIVTLILIIYGSLFLTLSKTYNDNYDYIFQLEKETGIDLPDSGKITTQDWTTDGQTERSTYLYYTSTVSFSTAEVKEFEEQIRTDEKWLKIMPSVLVGSLPDIYSRVKTDFYLLYNTDLKEFNTVPEKSGRYHFIYIFYDKANNSMQIAEYDIDIRV